MFRTDKQKKQLTFSSIIENKINFKMPIIINHENSSSKRIAIQKCSKHSMASIQDINKNEMGDMDCVKMEFLEDCFNKFKCVNICIPVFIKANKAYI